MIFYFQMLCSLTSAGAAEVPDLYSPAVTVSLGRPRPGVEVVLCTDTHLVEISQGLVVRSLPLSQNNKVVKTEKYWICISKNQERKYKVC